MTQIISGEVYGIMVIAMFIPTKKYKYDDLKNMLLYLLKPMYYLM